PIYIYRESGTPYLPRNPSLRTTPPSLRTSSPSHTPGVASYALSLFPLSDHLLWRGMENGPDGEPPLFSQTSPSPRLSPGILSPMERGPPVNPTLWVNPTLRVGTSTGRVGLVAPLP